ncbi:MAG: phosphatase PAP2 family protein [Pseudomonadota bacterium]|nr:phosphatase PAP2 family protein [Pseudomonadota bacterium]
MAQNKDDFKCGLCFVFPMVAAAMILTWVVMHYGYENQIATHIYNPDDSLSWTLRQYGTWPVMLITLLSLVYTIIVPLRRKSEMLRTAAAAWIVTMAIGTGLICSVITKDFVERPRPRDTVLTEGTLDATITTKGNAAEIVGKSFVSGHTATAAMLAVPFFALWGARRRKAAMIVFAAGTAYAGLIAYSRMVLGAHFLTDNIWAYVFVIGTAAFVTPIFANRDLSNKITLPVLGLAALCVVLFNDFRINVSIEPISDRYDLTFTCDHINILADNDESYFKATVTGAGAPISNVKLSESQMKVSMDTGFGLFRKMKCESADVRLKAGERIRIPKSDENPMKIVIGRYTQMNIVGEWYTFHVNPNVGYIDHTPIGRYPMKSSEEQK